MIKRVPAVGPQQPAQQATTIDEGTGTLDQNQREQLFLI